MTKTINLLDCTLRDGGYINDWNFGLNTMRDIIIKLVNSNIDLVEVGFLRNCEYDINKSLFNNCKEIENVLPMDRKNTKFVAMAMHNAYDINKLEPYDGKTIEFIRVTFHDYDIQEGLEFVKKVKDKGYKVYCNPINIMGYSDEQILKLISQINKIKPYAFSIVDTFGSMKLRDLIRIYSLYEHNLDKNIAIGIHLHENLSMAFYLAQYFIENANPQRKYSCDASLLGMGRVPGNLCIELIVDYMNSTGLGNYNINSIFDAIDEHIVKLKKINPWGYNITFSLSAKYNLHRNYAEFLLNKGKLNSKQINQILAKIAPNKKTAFDKNYIEQLYLDYQNIKINDTHTIEFLQKKLENNNILLLAPGNSLKKYKVQIEQYIKEYKPIIISANFSTEEFRSDFCFFSNIKRFETYIEQNNKTDNCIVTSNIKHSQYAVDNIVNYYNLAVDNTDLFDNCMIMLLRLLENFNWKSIAIAGFDGFSEDSSLNYIDTSLVNNQSEQDFLHNNLLISEKLKKLNSFSKLKFLTPSVYESEFTKEPVNV